LTKNLLQNGILRSTETFDKTCFQKRRKADITIKWDYCKSSFNIFLKVETQPLSSLCLLFYPGSMLKVNPDERLSITELVNQLQEIAAARNANPKSPITEVGVFVPASI